MLFVLAAFYVDEVSAESALLLGDPKQLPPRATFLGRYKKTSDEIDPGL